MTAPDNKADNKADNQEPYLGCLAMAEAYYGDEPRSTAPLTDEAIRWLVRGLMQTIRELEDRGTQDRKLIEAFAVEMAKPKNV